MSDTIIHATLAMGIIANLLSIMSLDRRLSRQLKLMTHFAESFHEATVNLIRRTNETGIQSMAENPKVAE